MNILQRLTAWFLVTVPLLAGLSTLEVEFESGRSLTGLAWVLQFVVATVLLLTAPMTNFDLRTVRCWWPWMIWYGWVWLSILWCNEADGRNIQEGLQLSMPLVIGLLATVGIRSREDLSKLILCFQIVLALLVAFSLIYVTGAADEAWLEQRARATALAAVFVGCIFLAGMPRRLFLPLAGWAGCLLVTVFTESRMATAALLAIPVFHPGFRSKWWNMGIALTAALAGIALFNTQMFQNRFFPETGRGTLQEVMEGSFISAGRFEAWPYIWEKAWEQPTHGWGVGSAYNFVPTVWPEMNHVHNDYLRIGFEFGLIGLGLFALAMLWQLGTLYLRIVRSEGVVQTAYMIAWMAFWGLLITSATDNTIVYNVFYTNPLFLVLGAAYGVSLAEGSQRDSRIESMQLRATGSQLASRPAFVPTGS